MYYDLLAEYEWRKEIAGYECGKGSTCLRAACEQPKSDISPHVQFSVSFGGRTSIQVRSDTLHSSTVENPVH